MTSITNIDLNLSEVNCAVVVYAKQNDKLARHIAATLYDGANAWTPPAGSHPIIRFLKPDGTSGFYDVDENEDPATTISGNVATMTIVEQALTVPGDVYMELNFYNGDGEKLTTLKWLLRVQASVLYDSTIISSDYYNVLTAQIAALLGATTNPPKIDPVTKNWLLWDEDTGAYVDSGYSSLGTQGPTGPQGVSISSVTKASGTGAPGTTDVYNVNLSNSTVAGTFNVYNGSDGTGSPGSQNPLMDGTASPGTAAAFSREDHVHPSDTAKVDKTVTLTSGTDLDDIRTSGFYRLQDNIDNIPSGASDWSQLIVSDGPAGVNNTTAQIFVDYTTGEMYVRTQGGGTWTGWRKVSYTSVIYLAAVACSATTGDFATGSDSEITADHVVASLNFAAPANISPSITWATGSGSVTLNGTCSAATTVDILLIKKDN